MSYSPLPVLPASTRAGQQYVKVSLQPRPAAFPIHAWSGHSGSVKVLCLWIIPGLHKSPTAVGGHEAALSAGLWVVGRYISAHRRESCSPLTVPSTPAAQLWMESFKVSVLDTVKRPVIWIQENLKDKVERVAHAATNNNNNKQTTGDQKPAKTTTVAAMSTHCTPEEKVVCEVTAKRRLAYQKSYSLEVGKG